MIPRQLFTTVDEAWTNFETAVLSPSTPPKVRAHTRDTFYSGALALLSVILCRAEAEGADDLDDVIHQLCRELGLVRRTEGGDA